MRLKPAAELKSVKLGLIHQQSQQLFPIHVSSLDSRTISGPKRLVKRTANQVRAGNQLQKASSLRLTHWSKEGLIETCRSLFSQPWSSHRISPKTCSCLEGAKCVKNVSVFQTRS